MGSMSKRLTMLACAGAIPCLCGLHDALAAPEIRWNPVAASGNVVCMPGTGECGETEITLSEGGVTVTLFLEVSGWDPDQNGDPSLGAYECELDFDTLAGGDTSGEGTIPGVDVVPVGYPDPSQGAFVTSHVCGDIFDPSDFDPLEGSLPGGGCSTLADCPAGRYCIERWDLLLGQPLPCDPGPCIPSYSWSNASTYCATDPDGGGTKFYGGTLLVDVPSGAEGTYNINFINDPNFTLLNSCPGPLIPGLTLTPARITIATGRCCSSIGPGTTVCEEDLSQSECSERSDPWVYAPLTSCSGWPVRDCNDNGIPDECDVLGLDCNGNGVPDDCDVQANDCNYNGIPDDCDIADGISADCNDNGIPDDCDIVDGASTDCNNDGTPDDCETDGDDDGVIDACDGCPTDPGKTSPGVCGCGIGDVDSDQDGVLDCNDSCPGMNDAIFAPSCERPVPTVSQWGIVVLSLLLLVAVAISFGRSRQAH